MYFKSTMFVTSDRKYIKRNGHTKKVSSVPADTKYINYYIFDMSGKGRSGMSAINFSGKTTDQDLALAASKA